MTTLLLAAVTRVGLFFMLLAGAGFMQGERFFNSAPQAIQDAVLPREKRFARQHDRPRSIDSHAQGMPPHERNDVPSTD